MKRLYKGKSLLEFRDNFVSIDVETTGMASPLDRIIEISAVRYENAKEVDVFTHLINPGFRITPFIENLTGIKNTDLTNMPDEFVVMKKFDSFIKKDDVFLAHNAHFDVNIIYDTYLRTFCEPFSYDFIDTLRLSRRFLKNMSHKLSDLLTYYGFETDGAHRAEFDARGAAEIYLKIKEEFANCI